MPSSSLRLAAGVEVTPYRGTDPLQLQFPEQALASYRGAGDLETIWRHYETAGPAWTLRVDGVVVGCAGLIRMWPGRAQAWLLPSTTLGRYPRTVLTLLVEELRALIADLHLVRIEANVQANFKLGCRMVEWLGFVAEGPPMLRYGPNDEDYQRYVIVQPREYPDHVA